MYSIVGLTFVAHINVTLGMDKTIDHFSFTVLLPEWEQRILGESFDQNHTMNTESKCLKIYKIWMMFVKSSHRPFCDP